MMGYMEGPATGHLDKYSEGPATGHLDTGFSWFPCVYKQMLRWLLPGGSGYFTCIQNMKLVTTEFRSGGLHEKHVVA